MRKTSPNATRYTAVALVVLGFLLIFFGWNGAAGPENGIDLRAQFPFLISGGIGGLALVLAGLTLVRTFEARRDALRLSAQLERLTAAVERLEATRTAQELAAANLREELPVTTAYPPPAAPPFEEAQP